MSEAAPTIRALMLADFSIGALGPFLGDGGEAPAISTTAGPFGQVTPVLLDPAHPCWASKPDILVVWTRPDAAIPQFARLIDGEPADLDGALLEVDRFVERLRSVASRVAAVFVPTWTWPAYDRGLGVLNMSPSHGPGYVLLRMNAHLVESLQTSPSIHVLDASRWTALAGPGAMSPKLWHLGKIAFAPEVLRLAAADIKAGVRAMRGEGRKLVVVDLDDTLWGGVVGDVGWNDLKLGGHDAVGESYRAFQRALKSLTRRGIVLGIVSKNSEAVALEAIDRHPEMVLRRGDFAGWRINWADKAENLVSLAAELRLGLHSTVFIDDNPAERARVREALPDVLVPDWPADKLLYEQTLRALTCFDALMLTEEDRSRTRTYAAERHRKSALAAAQSLDEYLNALELRVTAEPLGPVNIARATQLLNKTNQMNLTTRRLTQEELLTWAERAGHHGFAFRVADRFDDYGLTGLAGFSVDGATARMTDFVLSCRVMGRGVEQAMLHVLAEAGRILGLAGLEATCVPTPRNAPCREFFEQQSGFERNGEALRFSWDLRQAYSAPAHLLVERGEKLCQPHGVLS